MLQSLLKHEHRSFQVLSPQKNFRVRVRVLVRVRVRVRVPNRGWTHLQRRVIPESWRNAGVVSLNEGVGMAYKTHIYIPLSLFFPSQARRNPRVLPPLFLTEFHSHCHNPCFLLSHYPAIALADII